MKKPAYDWARAFVAVASTMSVDLNELAVAAELDPRTGDMSDIDLAGLDLSGQNLAGWDLRDANLKDTRITGAELRGAILDPWQLVEAKDWENAQLDQEVRELVSSINPGLLARVDDLELSVRTGHCLRSTNCKLVGDLVRMTEGEVLRIPNFGRKSLNEVKEVLAQMGLHLGMSVKPWPPRARWRAG